VCHANDVVPNGTNEKIQLERVGFFGWRSVGFFIALSSQVVLFVKRSLPAKLVLWATSLAKMCHRHVFASLTHDLRVIASRRSPSQVVLFVKRSLPAKLLALDDTACKNAPPELFASLTQRATLVGITRGHKAQSQPLHPTQKGHLMVAFALCCTAKLDATLKKSIKPRDFEFWRLFHVHPK